MLYGSATASSPGPYFACHFNKWKHYETRAKAARQRNRSRMSTRRGIQIALLQRRVRAMRPGLMSLGGSEHHRPRDVLAGSDD